MEQSFPCGVCNETSDAFHFGALSCSACAAFFRRIVVRNRIPLQQCPGTCDISSQVLRRICTRCRYQKCLNIGMKPSLVQAKTSQATETQSLLEELKEAYQDLSDSRKKTFKNEGSCLTFFEEMDDVCGVDITLILETMMKKFTKLTPVSDDQLRCLITNFVGSFIIMDQCYRSIESNYIILANDNYVDGNNLDQHFQSISSVSNETKVQQAKQLLVPYWKIGRQILDQKYKELRIDLNEHLFICGLVYWDFGLPNQTEDCINMESPPNLLPNLQICGVCGENADAVHFGALSCRACAAFFRRRVAAGKLITVSRCEGKCKLENQLLRRLCPSCRYEKCIRIGMKTSAVLSRMAVKMEPGSSLSPWMGQSLLEQMRAAYARLQNARRDAFMSESHVPQSANYKELNALCTIDIDLIVLHYTSFFQSITPVDEEQRKNLGVHFLIPFCLLEGGFRSQDSELYLMPNGDYVDLKNLDDFYQDPDEKDTSIAGGVTSLMEPYWRLNNQVLRKHLKEVRLDLTEFLFVSALIFWDFGITNQSDACIQICKQMRSRVIEELTNYEKSLNRKEDHSMRVGEIVIVLQPVQKALGIMNECRDISMVYNLYGRECPLFRVPENNEFR